MTSGAVVLLLFPAVYYLWRSRGLPEAPEGAALAG